MTEDQYTRLVESIYERDLKDRIVKHLKKIGDFLTDAGFKCSQPYDLTDDQFRWSLLAERDDLPESIDISIEVAESLQYEGSTEGINIGLDIVGYGGRIIGGITPYNYTPLVWVSLDEPEEILNRLEMIEYADYTNLVELIEGAYVA